MSSPAPSHTQLKHPPLHFSLPRIQVGRLDFWILIHVKSQLTSFSEVVTGSLLF